MRIAWVGWIGPCMNEHCSGLWKYDPKMLSYIVGYGEDPSHKDYMLFGTRRFEKVFINKDILFQDLQEFDVILYDTYIFSKDDPIPHLRTLLPGNGCVTQWPEWRTLRGKTILFDGESNSGKTDWYLKHLQYFNHTITTNKYMPGHYTYLGVDPDVFYDRGEKRTL